MKPIFIESITWDHQFIFLNNKEYLSTSLPPQTGRNGPLYTMDNLEFTINKIGPLSLPQLLNLLQEFSCSLQSKFHIIINILIA